MTSDLKAGQIVTFASPDGSWVRRLQVKFVDGDNVTYEVCDG